MGSEYWLHPNVVKAEHLFNLPQISLLGLVFISEMVTSIYAEQNKSDLLSRLVGLKSRQARALPSPRPTEGDREYKGTADDGTSFPCKG